MISRLSDVVVALLLGCLSEREDIVPHGVLKAAVSRGSQK
jgi:hypothetical protein